MLPVPNFDIKPSEFSDLDVEFSKAAELLKKATPEKQKPQKAINIETKTNESEIKKRIQFSHQQVTYKIQQLENALLNPTGQDFQKLKEQTAQLLKEEKQKCLNDLAKLNGSFYEDPLSQLKQAWDTLVSTILSLFRIEIKTRGDIDNLRLNNTAYTVQKYLKLETTRDGIEKRIKEIISIEKASNGADSVENPLLEEKNRLIQRKEELCGNNNNGLLDTAWKNYKNATTDTSSTLFTTYRHLDEERRVIDAKLFACNEQIALEASQSETIESLTITSIKEEIKSLKEQEKITNIGIEMIKNF